MSIQQNESLKWTCDDGIAAKITGSWSRGPERGERTNWPCYSTL